MTTPNQPNDERHQTNGVTERIAPSPIPPRPIPRPVASAENGQPGGGQQSGGQPGGHPGGGHPGGAQPGGHQGQPNGPQSGGHPNGPQSGGHPGGPQANPPGGNQPNAQPHEIRDQQGDFAPQQGAPDQAPGGDGQDRFDQKTTRINNQAPQSAPESEDKQPVGAAANGGPQSPYQDGWAQLPQREPQSNLYRPGQAPVTGRPSSGGGGGLGGGTSNARTTADLAAKAARKEAAMVKSVGIDGPTRSIARPELIKDMPDLSEIRHPLPATEAAAPQSGPVSPAVPVAVAAVASGEPLRATVQIRRIDPWSTLKISLVISVAMFFVWMLAVGLLYIVLEGMGVWERLNNTFTDMVSQDSGSVGLIDAGTVFGYAGVIGLINVVLFTALGTVGTFIYNQCCDLVGGIQVTLADPD
ncbi:hypothetical protein IFM12275_32930 [Nocardia sputorum]|uniref:DUF3566 domain-containing protein n=1 Tax=Nocardia sputorum TaxID=2984338 RepID=UPI0024918A20|nr:DUF3566 domain-containing protein [Nocardia sputorum]BDT93317.1 hypothetical protein IFM12275_32930 [Nocardia sputorum]